LDSLDWETWAIQWQKKKNKKKKKNKNLMKHGYPLILCDVFPGVCKEFKEAGEQVVSSPSEVDGKADSIITMLPSSMNSVEVYSGANRILKKKKKSEERFIINRFQYY
jgi:3-hydroxyisobutyrate dehydrogenase-like beta-hydroxyacid dehydrogenase